MTLSTPVILTDAERHELLQLLRTLVAFPTVNTGVMPTGDESPCARWLAGVLGRERLEVEVIESAPNRGNLVARLRGSGGGPTLLLMAHLDVVPPGDVSRWTVPPFSGEVIDGWVYGRGSNDCKSLAAAGAAALLILARSGVRSPLAGDVILALGADEEAGGQYGFGYLAEHHPDLLRADLAINEGGGSPTRLPDGRSGFFCAIGEKGRYEATITILGRSEHASTPWLADNPLNRLSEVLRRLATYRPEVALDPAIVGSICRLWEVPLPDAEGLERLLREREGSHPAETSRLRALTRLTIAPTVVAAGAKSNAIPDRATLSCDIRALPSQSVEYARGELLRLLSGMDGVQVRVEPTAHANRSELTESVAEVFRGALADAGTPHAELLPTLCAGFTDSRLVRPLGIPVVGLSPLPPGTDLSRCGCHNLDEQFPVAGLEYRTRFILGLARRFCGTGG